ncbi:Transmembrane osmosensor [Ascosphaera aggregata]|nr:Transmembrane osmosensor [Ascosphaera aggregata]
MAQIDMLNITGDPFALITISVAIIGWIVAFVSAIFVEVQTDFPNHSWWTIGFMFMIIVGVIFVFGSNTAHVYGIAALWIFYFGSAPFTGARRWIDSYSNKEYPSYGANQINQRDKIPHHSVVTAARYSLQPETRSTGNVHNLSTIGSSINGQISHGYSNSFAAAGTSNPLYAVSNSGGHRSGTSSSQRLAHGPTPGDEEDEDHMTHHHMGNPEEEEDIPVPTSYPYRAKAIYTYEANPEDANEIGFLKNEILEVSDVSGRWWQARKANGETGIAPSNYLILL